MQNIRKRSWGLLSAAICLCVTALTAQTDLVGDVRAQLQQNSFSAAESELSSYKSQHGVTPEYLEALSWMARGAAAASRWDQAISYASETRTLAEQQLATSKNKLDAEPHLPIALGAAYEVLWKYIDPSPAPEKSQSTGPGRSTRPALAGNPVSRTEAANSGVAEGFARSLVLLGALVCGLQSRSPRDRPLAPGIRSRGPGCHRPDPALRLRCARCRRRTRTGARVHRIRSCQILLQPPGHAGSVEQTELQCLWSEYNANSGRPESRRASGDVSSRCAFV